MTETKVKLGELQQSIAHLAEISEEGWVLKWADPSGKTFELVCKEANALQVQKIDALVSEAFPKALAQLA